MGEVPFPKMKKQSGDWEGKRQGWGERLGGEARETVAGI